MKKKSFSTLCSKITFSGSHLQKDGGYKLFLKDFYDVTLRKLLKFFFTPKYSKIKPLSTLCCEIIRSSKNKTTNEDF